MDVKKDIASVSVIIATYRRKSYLLHVLDCLAVQTHPPTEVLIVDASPAEEQLSAEILKIYPSWLKYIIYAKTQGNASGQRNEAIRNSSGDLLVFLDDDVDFGDDLIASYIQALEESGADGLAGRISIPGKNLDAKKPIKKFASQIHDPGSPNFIACDFYASTYVICTANFAAYRSCIVQIGGFDEQIRGTIDDVDLGLRLVKQEYVVMHSPIPHVIHFMAKDSGARSENYTLTWSLAHLFYFQFKHFPEKNKKNLYWNTIWNYCRPSRIWLNPSDVFNRITAINEAYQIAANRNIQGPIYI